jgi:hypothetical protein
MRTARGFSSSIEFESLRCSIRTDLSALSPLVRASFSRSPESGVRRSCSRDGRQWSSPDVGIAYWIALWPRSDLLLEKSREWQHENCLLQAGRFDSTYDGDGTAPRCLPSSPLPRRSASRFARNVSERARVPCSATVLNLSDQNLT